jgi:hypothetical protein
MRISLLNITITAIAILMCAIAFYHISTLGDLNKEIMKSIYHISHNSIIISLLYYVRSSIKNIEYAKKHRKIIAVIFLYFIYKIILNIAYMFESFRNFIENYNTHIFSFMLSGFILISLIIIKYIKHD